jgi:DNA repair exonuclease SbcCD ATPase subunit
MKLTSVKVVNVKGLKDGEYPLSAVTYVCGGNRSGKTAILQAVQYAVFGRCDEMGSKGVGALVRSGGDFCSIEVVGDEVVFAAKVSVKKNGTISQSRVCKINGLEVSSAEVSKILGDVPTTLAQFNALTGEEMWRLIMPQDESNKVPADVVQAVDAIADKLEGVGMTGSSSQIRTALEMEADSVSHATAILEAVSGAQREARSTARALLKTIESDEKPYDGPPLADLKIEEKELKQRMQQIQESIRSINRIRQTIEYNRQQVESQQKTLESSQADIARLSPNIARIDEVCSIVDQLLTIMPDFIDHAKFSSTFFSNDVRQLLEAIKTINPNHDMCNLAAKFTEAVNQYIAQRTYVIGADCHLDELISQAIQGGSEWGYQVNEINRSAFESLRVSLSKHRLTVASTVDTCAKRVVQCEEKIAALMAETVHLEAQSDVATDESVVAVVSQKLSSVMDLIAKAQAYNARVAQAQTARMQAITLESLDAFFDHAIERLQSYRALLLRVGIESVQAGANAIIERIGLSKIVLEPVTGKRPSLVVKNEAGSLYSGMSGAERLIYGAALIRSIHAVRKVGMSLLFLEGGELDHNYTTRLVHAMSQCGEVGNTILAHWVNNLLFDSQIGVVNV